MELKVGGNDTNGGRVKDAVQRSLRILQDANGTIYIDPDAQHYSNFKGDADLLSIYSREIEALRRLTIQLVGICSMYGKVISGECPIGIDRITLDEVNMYLEAASWNLTLMLDRKLQIPAPD